LRRQSDAERIGAVVVMGLLDGRVALVTGGARGLGRAIAERLATAGAMGVLLDRASEIAAASPLPGFEPIVADVADETSVAAALARVADRCGRLDIVVANAGVVPPWRETAALDLDEWDRVMAINVRGVAATLKHAVPALARSGGTVVVMASVNAVTAHPRQMAYTASKHAVLGIVRAAAQDLGRFGIRVNGLAPGPIATEALLARVRARAGAGGPSEAEALAALAAEAALGRLATVDDVAKAALFLASELSSGITGHLLPVDAGLP
jgi:NAD(P)-dependent dehydrogenase (short-subunit alcohol dehydrogenase family)